MEKILQQVREFQNFQENVLKLKKNVSLLQHLRGCPQADQEIFKTSTFLSRN